MTVRILDSLPLHAGRQACASCGSQSTKRKYVDFDISTEFEGKFFICVPCIVEAAGKLGWVTDEFHESVKNTNQRLLKRNESLESRVSELTDQNDALAREQVTRAEEHKTAVEKARIQAIQETERRLAPKAAR